MSNTERITLKDLPISERPYERIIAFGAETLSDAELLSVIIKSGTKEFSAVDVSRSILASKCGTGGIANIRDMSVEQLEEIKGIGKVKAVQLKAVAEISKRMASTSILERKVKIRSSDDVAKILMEEMRGLKKEIIKLILLNSKSCVIKVADISVGGLSASYVHPREIFAEAVRFMAAAIIVVHNHPSGDSAPSEEDIDATNRLYNVGEIMGIPLLDHLIIGDRSYTSLKHNGLIGS